MERTQLKPIKKVEDFLSQLRRLSHPARRRVLLKNGSTGIPRFHYKYVAFDVNDPVSIDRLRQLIVDCVLRLSSPSEFNDPYDLSCYTDYTGTPLQMRTRLDKMLKELRPDLDRKARDREISNMLLDQKAMFKRADESTRQHAQETGVGCFTTDPRNILMWSHYAKHHTGLVLQFETSRDLDVFTRPVTVNYEKAYPIRRWVDNDLDAIGRMLTQKFDQWSYEKERRIVLPAEAGKALGYLPSALSGIILGCKSSDASREKVVEMINERSGRPPKLYKAVQHDQSYRLMIRRIES